MDEAIRSLLDALEAAEAAGAPLTDTVIRESLYDIFYQGFVHQESGFCVPDDLLLHYTPAAEQQNAIVVNAWIGFLERARQAAVVSKLDTPEQRERAFLDSEVTSSSGDTNVCSYFD